MDLNICNNCGGTYEYRGGRYVCRACGSYRYENLSDEEREAVHEAAKMIFAGDFEAAEEAFGKIIFRYPATAEAYWGRLKAHYRVLYAQDMYGRMTPISCEPLSESFLSTLDYRKAIGFSDMENAYFLKAQAEVIEGLRIINGQQPAMQTAVPNIVPDITEEIREEPREAIREDVREEAVEEDLPTVDEEEISETEARAEIPDAPKKPKSKAGRRVLGLILVAGVIVGVNVAFSNAHSKTSGNDNQIQTTQRPAAPSYSMDIGEGDSGDPIVAVSQGLSFKSNGDGTCTLIGIGSCKDSNLVIPSEYNGMSVAKIGDNAFMNNQNLRSVTIADSVTSIGYSAFYGCGNLTSVTISKRMTSTGTSSFRLCPQLNEIHYNGTIEQWGKINFGVSWDSGTAAYTVYCSNGMVPKK